MAVAVGGETVGEGGFGMADGVTVARGGRAVATTGAAFTAHADSKRASSKVRLPEKNITFNLKCSQQIK
jgi:hypothetical protein